MGAPGTLIPTEVPSAHPQNFELDARNIGTIPGSLDTFCIDERPKPSTSSAPSAVSLHSNVRGRRSAGIILTEQLEHNVEDLYLPLKDNSREDQVSSTRNCSREDQVGEHNELPIWDRVDDQDHAVECCENEHSLIPLTGQQLLNISYESSRDVETSGNNVQIEPVLNGVAEIFWEDLQIGERIGIGKNFSCIFHFSLLKFMQIERCACSACFLAQRSPSVGLLPAFEYKIMLYSSAPLSNKPFLFLYTFVMNQLCFA